MDFSDKIYVAGHNGMVGSALVRKLKTFGFNNIITASSEDLDLRNQQKVKLFFNDHKPKFVFLAAAKVGGIAANNSLKGDFIYDNLMIQSNVIHSSLRTEVNKLLFLGSSCIYPKKSKQPIKEEYLLSGYLEPTNEPYAIAKIAGLKMCEYYREQYGSNFISAMPTNLYGPNDNFNLETSHVFAAFIRKFHEAKIQNHSEVKLWGTGAPKREFLHVDDLADALVFLMKIYNSSSIINIGTGEDISITDLAKKIQKVVGYKGIINWDKSMPDGTFRKWLDVSKINDLGWKANTSLLKGIEMTYDWYSRNFS